MQETQTIKDPINQSLEDVENGDVKLYCPNCHIPQIKLVLMTSFGRPTKNFIGACINQNCFRFTNLSKLTTWVPVAGKKW